MERMADTSPGPDADADRPWGDESWSPCEDRIKQFERAWKVGTAPAIEDFLSTQMQHRTALLLELVHVDLEFRLKAGEAARVETYLDTYPELADQKGAVIDLLVTEFEWRRRRNPDVDSAEYYARFPDLVAELSGRFGEVRNAAPPPVARPRRAAGGPLPRVPGYEIVSEVGRGGMGVVFVARDMKLGRTVAVKFLPDEVAQDEVLLSRFVREARTASALNHPHICTVHALGEHDGRPFFVMEFIEGQTLRAMAQSPTATADLVRAVRQTAAALVAAHAAGVIHRDLKPENIMVRPDGYAKVVDFGLAHRPPDLAGDTLGHHDTSPGALLGTIAYMSPEQSRAQPLESSSDIFSLGIVLYELLAGRHPFRQDTAIGTLHAIAEYDPPAPSHWNPEVTAGMDGLVAAMLNKSAPLRPSAAGVEAALAAMARHQFQRETPTRPIVRRPRERAVLRDAFAEADAGRGNLIAVAGEPGLGKTTLVEDFLAELGASTFVGRGQSSERQAATEPFLPVIEAVAGLARSDPSGSAARLLKALAPTWHQWISRAAANEDAPAESQPAVLRELTTFLDELARLGPVVLFLDDVHWADLSTVDLIAHLGRYLRRLRALVVVSYRPTELLLGPHPYYPLHLELHGQGVARELELGFWDRNDIEQYLSLAFPGNDFPSDFTRLLESRTEGSPLFVVDLLRDLSDRKIVAEADGRWALAREVPDLRRDIPATVRSVIRRKLDRLAETDRRLLAVAAVQGGQFDSASVAAALNSDPADIEERLQVLQRVHGLVRLVREDEYPDRTLTVRYAFVHSLYQQALDGDLAPSRRAAYCRAMARALERHFGGAGDAIAAELAYLSEAGRDAEAAARHYHAAARNAARVFAHRDAIELARRGIRLVEGLPESADRAGVELPLQTLLGLQVQVADGYAAEAAKQAYDRALQLCPPALGSETSYPVLWGLWLYYKVRSDLPRAQDVADELLAAARLANNPDLVLQSHQALGLTALCRGRPEAAIRHAHEVTTHYDPTRHLGHAALFGQDPAVICRAYGAVARWLVGQRDEAMAESVEAIQWGLQLSPSSQVIAYFFAAMLHQMAGNERHVRILAELAMSLAAEHDFSFWQAGNRVLVGWAVAVTEDGEAGLAQMRNGIRAWQATGSQTYVTYYQGLLADVLIRMGRPTEARAVLKEALELVVRSDERFYEAELRRSQRGQTPE